MVRVGRKSFNMQDMRGWFMARRKGDFPQVLYFGHGRNQISGEGQSGGRYVVEHVHATENALVAKYGIEGYRRRMDKLMRH
jgi:hypothetical protein